MNPDRRRLIISAAGVAAGGMATARLLPEEMLLRDRRPRRSRVAIIAAQEYSESLEGVLVSGLREFHLNLRGRSVLLKPNLVEYIAGVEVNTNPVLVSAAAQAFLKLGADSVVVGEGPGHQRDTYLVLAESGLADQLRSQKISFVDLNRDELFKVPTRATYTGLEHLWLPGTVLNSDFVVSMPKIKTHHWAGVTLEHEEHVRGSAGHKVRLAQERSALEGHPPQHSRYLCDGSSAFRHRGRHCCDGRQRAAARNSPASRKDRSRRRSRSRGFHVCAPDGSRSISCLASRSGGAIPRKWLL